MEKWTFEQLTWAQNEAELGNVNAQFALGFAYYMGEGVEFDFRQSVYYLTQAAKQNDAMSQAYLGSCYSEGLGVECDEKKAVYWWEKSAKQGNNEAELMMMLFSKTL